MRRRKALYSLVVGVPLLGGCLSDSNTSGAPDRTSGSPTAERNEESARRLAIDHVETFTHAVRLNDLGNSPGGSIPLFSSFEEREREILENALDSGYETDDPETWLVKFATGTPTFRKEGRYYRLENTFPTYTVTAKSVEEDFDGDVATDEEYEAAVTHDGRVTSGLMRIARREGYELSYLWPDLREFLSAYDAVRYRGDVLAFSLSVEDSGAPYEITARRVSPTDLVDESIWDVTNASTDLRSTVRRAGEREGLYALDDPPDGLLEGLDSHEYVYLDGTFYTTYVEKRGPLPVSLSATIPDATLDASGAAIRLELRNESDREIGVMSGAPPPFGVLRFRPVAGGETSHLLWTDAYEESGHVHVDGHEVGSVNSIGLSSSVAPGDTLGRTFVVEQTDLPAGAYVVEDNVEVSKPDGVDGTFPYRVVFEITE